MRSLMSIQDAARLWGCSERSAQLFCKQGMIPGACKVAGVWLLPRDSVHPRSHRRTQLPPFRPERLYGRNATVRVSPDPTETQLEEHGCTVTQYQILDGISLVFQNIHEDALDYGNDTPKLPEDLIAIQYCREGRFEGEYPNGECIYMGPGSLSINLPAWSPAVNSFPLKHYRGFYIAVLPSSAGPAIKRLEQSLGPLQIDFTALTSRISGKNRLAFFAVNEQISLLLAAIYATQDEIRQEQLKLQILALLQLLSTQEALSPSENQYFTRDQVNVVKEIRQYLITHLDQRISLSDLADRYRISLTGMKTCFKGVYGQTMGKYLREYRLQTGAEQLTATDRKVIEIAAALGYENASKFSEAFSGYYGMTPSEYRKTFCPPGGLSNGKE